MRFRIVSGFLLTLIVFVVLCPSVARLTGNAVYYGQTSSGSNNGTSCANAYAYNDATNGFNAVGNWSATPSGTQIGPDTTVHLCGTFTGSAGGTLLQVKGSGTSGHPVIILFESGANLSAPYWYNGGGSGTGGAINTEGYNYITINGGANGIIQNTQNGSALTYQKNTVLLELLTSSNVTVENLSLVNAYVHTTALASDVAFPNMVASEGSGSNITFTGNTAHDCGWCLSGWGIGSDNITFANNNIYNADHDIASAPAHMYVYGNHMHDWALWGGNFPITNITCAGGVATVTGPINQGYTNGQGGVIITGNSVSSYNATVTTTSASSGGVFTFTPGGGCAGTGTGGTSTTLGGHHDGLHCFAGSTGNTLAAYVYNNIFDGDPGIEGMNQPIFLEGAGSTTKCMASGGAAYIFNNVFNFQSFTGSFPAFAGLVGGAGFATPIIGIYANNTGIANSPGSSMNCALIGYVNTATMENNACGGTGILVGIDAQAVPMAVVDYNAYQHCTSFNCFDTSFVDTGSFTVWKAASCTGSANTCDQHGIASLSSSTFFNVDSTGKPLGGSPLIQTGANLTSICNGQPNPGLGALCFDINGIARASTGAWDIGAYQFVPATPKGISAGNGIGAGNAVQ